MKRVTLIVTSDVSKSAIGNSMLRLIQKDDMSKWLEGGTDEAPDSLRLVDNDKLPAKVLSYKDSVEIHLSTEITAKELGHLEAFIYALTGRRYPDKQFDYITIEYGCHMKSNLKDYIARREDN